MGNADDDTITTPADADEAAAAPEDDTATADDGDDAAQAAADRGDVDHSDDA
jgi:hypothetical protein